MISPMMILPRLLFDAMGQAPAILLTVKHTC